MTIFSLLACIWGIVATPLASASELVLIGEQHWPAKQIIEKTKFGGISSLAIEGNKVFLLSDDRGLVNEPRFYEMTFAKTNKGWNLTAHAVHFLIFPKSKNLKEIVDPESLVLSHHEGKPTFLISSEGDNNKKPRVMPRLFEVDGSGDWIRDLRLPDYVLPELVGRQTMGVANNFSIESMTLSSDGKDLWFLTERPLLQDLNERDKRSRFRLFHLLRQGGAFRLDGQLYLESPELDGGPGIPVVTGWTELLHLGDLRFWILERTLRVVAGAALRYDCRLIEADFSEASEVSKVKSLAGAMNLRPAKIIRTQNLLAGAAALGNCEGMAMGPSDGEYRKTLWIVTDNNFSKSLDTSLYFFGVKN